MGSILRIQKSQRKKILDYNFQSLDLLKGGNKCLLLLADKCPPDVLNDMDKKNIETLSLVGDNIN